MIFIITLDGSSGLHRFFEEEIHIVSFNYKRKLHIFNNIFFHFFSFFRGDTFFLTIVSHNGNHLLRLALI